MLKNQICSTERGCLITKEYFVWNEWKRRKMEICLPVSSWSSSSIVARPKSVSFTFMSSSRRIFSGWKQKETDINLKSQFYNYTEQKKSFFSKKKTKILILKFKITLMDE